MGHQKLNTLARQPFDSLMLQPKLCDIVKEFLCARWHRQRQADRVGRQWYEAAVRNQARVRHDSRIASLSVMVHLGQRQILSASRRRPASDNTDRSPPHELRQDPPMPLSTSSEPVQSINPFVTAEILRTNSVPWHVSPARPAILTSVANIWADVQDSTLRKLSLSEEVDNIHCMFCLTEDEDLANECVILRCQCRALSHLACAEVWRKSEVQVLARHAVCGNRNEGPLDALIRPLRVQSSDTETRHVHTASKPSPDRELATIRNSSPNDPSQSQPHQRSVGYQGMSVEQSLENGPRRSARVAGAYLPRDPSTSAPLRRSARLNSTQRR
ncbi:unnamed protein product [Penicillium salamii]|uniref:RING-CH-type domain-containing protein n=1 Tax=Penicillium salamii TaxID=1612424 RepID=A0A9W4N3F9_9EURO|nr:unnamed protein product [Penicillium salamii]CAG7967031.1 unnamed protein product [Penicillium salamii]CAG8055609.1 unnamed protein product [Penicillium salamii]CAG8240240.1 unnamed protein product [Penicillium salamii]CAG8309812.1 unnamed protein product [Penicillium salamii]